jgi:Holliday junction resolvase
MTDTSSPAGSDRQGGEMTGVHVAEAHTPGRGNNYRRGAKVEYLVMKHLRDEGYVVIRAAGSHGPADLVALKVGETLLVQVTRGRKSQADLDKLCHLAGSCGAAAILAQYAPRKPLELSQVGLNMLTRRYELHPYLTDVVA